MFSTVLMAALAFGWATAVDVPLDGTTVVVVLGLVLGVPLVFVAVPALVARPQPSQVIQLGAHGLTFPKLASEPFMLRFEEISNVELRGRGARTTLVIDAHDRQIAIPALAFEPPTAAEELVRGIRDGIASLPDGRGRITEIDRLGDIARTVLGRRPVVTWALAAVMLAIFGATYSAGLLDAPFALVRAGANATVLVRTGQVERLLASTFVHANVLHVYVVGLAMFTFGALIERLLRWEAFLVVFVASAAGGALAAAASGTAPISLGATAPLFGLAGALGVLNATHRQELPHVFRRRWSWWLLVITANAFLPMFVPQIDFAANLGGLVTGALVTYLLVADRPITKDGVELGPAVGAAAWGATVLTVLSLAGAATRLQRTPEADEVRVAETFFTTSEPVPVVLNAAAWEVALTPSASRALLEAAKKGAERAIANAPREMLYALEDTLATIEVRLGNHDRAIALERRVLAESEKMRADAKLAGPRLDDHIGEMATQLGRFLVAKVEASPGAPVTVIATSTSAATKTATSSSAGPGTPAPSTTITARFVEGRGDAIRPVVALDLPGVDRRVVLAYLLPMQGRDLRALVEVCVGPAHRGRVEVEIEPAAAAETVDWPAGPGSTLVVGLVEARAPDAKVAADAAPFPCTTEGGVVRARAWKTRTDVLAYPR